MMRRSSSGGCRSSAPDTSGPHPRPPDRDRKQLIRCLIEDVTIDVARGERRAQLTIQWKGAAITELAVTLPKPQPAIRTDEDTIELIRRLAAHPSRAFCDRSRIAAG